MRKRRAPKRYVQPDPKHNDVLVAKFVNTLMIHGKKTVARNIIYDAFDLIEERTKKPGLEVFKKAMQNAQPMVEVRSRRVGGATYQVPMEVRPDRRAALAMRWLKRFTNGRGEKTMAARLAGELIDASNGEGGTVKKREETHRMADANKAFAHFRW
ncbi:MAG: 30S ribosomal protein S7 [Ignavibacteriales bacterium]|nr:30S ribosomal protein S7 [Ignavibacteriales bacterium]